MGDRYFDLANFAINNGLDEARADGRSSSATSAAPPSDAQLASLRLFTFMSDFREAMWGVVQTVASELDFDFAGYAAEHFDRMAATAAAPEFADGARGGAWRLAASLPTRPAA